MTEARCDLALVVADGRNRRGVRNGAYRRRPGPRCVVRDQSAEIHPPHHIRGDRTWRRSNVPRCTQMAFFGALVQVTAALFTYHEIIRSTQVRGGLMLGRS